MTVTKKFKVGDRVVLKTACKIYPCAPVGVPGTVRELPTASAQAGVEFDERFKYGHDLNLFSYKCPNGFGYYVELASMSPYEEPAPAPKPVEFKVGDRVRFTDKCHIHWWFGPTRLHKEGVISKAGWTSQYPWEVEVPGHGQPAFVSAEHIELIPPTTPPSRGKPPARGTFILILNEGGNLKPAPRPRVYTTREQAKRVALEMAQRHGKTFEVFHKVASAESVEEIVKTTKTVFKDA